MAVTYAALGDNVVGKSLHIGIGPLSTVTSMQLWVQRRLREVVVLVEIAGKALRQFAGFMVINIAATPPRKGAVRARAGRARL